MRAVLLTLLLLPAPVAWGAPAEARLTLDQVLVAARAANARLPVAQQDVKAAQARERAAAGQLLPQIAVESDVLVAAGGSTYGGTGGFPGDDRLQLVARQPLFQGGELQARESQARAGVQSARASYRAAEKDLEVNVRSLFATAIEAQAELEFRQVGLERLHTYLAGVRARRAAGEGAVTDLLKTQTRVADEEANVADVQRQLDDARLQLNELMGQDPLAALELAAPPDPSTPPTLDGSGWDTVPELVQARAELESAAAGIDVVRAGRLPHAAVQADAGLLGPGFSAGTSANFGSRLRSDLGVSLTLSVTWPILDFGIYGGHREEAAALEIQAERRVAEQSRFARLEWARARTQLTNLYRVIEARRRALPIARDTYLGAESLYRGGSSTALEVLDAYAALIDASRLHAQAVLAYRQAEAQAIRWGTP
jgi:outer membrane protein TolC